MSTELEHAMHLLLNLLMLQHYVWSEVIGILLFDHIDKPA